MVLTPIIYKLQLYVHTYEDSSKKNRMKMLILVFGKLHHWNSGVFIILEAGGLKSRDTSFSAVNYYVRMYTQYECFKS